MIILVAPPAGPAYNFIVDLYSQYQCPPIGSYEQAANTFKAYPGVWINGFVAAGLIYLQFKKSENWSSPWHTYLPVTLLFLAMNVFLAIVPFIPPSGSWDAEGYPYYIFPVVGVGVLILGGLYWTAWTKVLPSIGGYKVVAERRVTDDGAEVVRYIKVRTKDGSRLH